MLKKEVLFISGIAVSAAAGILYWYLYSTFIASHMGLAILGFLPTMLTGAAGYLAGYPFKPARVGALAGAAACAVGAALAVPALLIPPPLFYAFVVEPPATAVAKLAQDAVLGALTGLVASKFAEEGF